MSVLTKAGLVRKRVSPGAPIHERLALHAALDDQGCLIWMGATNGVGYGVLTVGGQHRYAHRVSYEYATGGPIPAGLEVDHLCRRPACCMPTHLEAVTPAINVRRGFSPGAVALRRDACLYGHPYAEHGEIQSGRRICVACRVIYMRLYREVPYAEAMRRKYAGEPVVDLAAYFAEQAALARSA